jgi:hypothetical protein
MNNLCHDVINEISFYLNPIDLMIFSSINKRLIKILRKKRKESINILLTPLFIYSVGYHENIIDHFNLSIFNNEDYFENDRDIIKEFETDIEIFINNENYLLNDYKNIEHFDKLDIYVEHNHGEDILLIFDINYNINDYVRIVRMYNENNIKLTDTFFNDTLLYKYKQMAIMLYPKINDRIKSIYQQLENIREVMNKVE